MTDMTAEQHLEYIREQLGAYCEDAGHLVPVDCEQSFDALRQALSAPRVPDDNRISDLLAALDKAKMLSLEIVNGALLTAAQSPAEPAQDELAKLRESYRVQLSDYSAAVAARDAELAKLRERVKVLEGCIETIRTSLHKANDEGAISDTLWASDCETLFDYIEAARLRQGGGQ